MRPELRFGCFLFMTSLFLPSLSKGDSIVLGFDTLTPTQIYTTGGTYQQDFGPDGATAGIEENGLMYIVQPSLTGTTSTITALYANETVEGSFTVPDLIADGAPGTGGTLWLSGFDGTVYNVTTTGTVLSSFSTGYTHAGVASNGSTLYTTEGDGGDGIDVWTTSGTIESTVHTGYTSLYGLAYDPANGDLYAGSTDFVYQMDPTTGSVLNTYDILGDSRTPNGAVHDGLEVADLSTLIGPPPVTTVPEPATIYFISVLFGGILLVGLARNMRSRFWKAAIGAVLAGPLFGSVTAQLNLNLDTAPVGTPITFTASATDSASSSATFVYRFSVSFNSGAFAMVREYHPETTFTWAPTVSEGSYTVQVSALSSTGASGTADQPLTVTSLVTGNTPAVTATANPLVALYSAPPCAAPDTVRVRFKSPTATSWQATPLKTCTGRSLNFYIAGMYASTTYTLQQDTYKGPFDRVGPALSFSTGAIPATVTFATRSTITGPVTPTSISYPFILQMTNFYPFATDLQGNVVWYLAAYNPAHNPQEGGILFRTTNQGTVIGNQDTPGATCPSTGQLCGDHEFLREFDLAGNIVRETNATWLSQALSAIRVSQGQNAVHLTYFDHEGYRLPNGDTVVELLDEEIADQGQGPVDVFGNAVLVLDSNFQIVWSWDTFDHLDITRKALLNNTCLAGQGGCGIIHLKQPNGQYYTVANDWTHINSMTLDPSDNNLIVSSRHQAWVWKVAYENGSGDGHIIWTLGRDGSFSLPNGDPDTTWFDYQHDVKFQANGDLTVFDNGDYRVSLYGGNSRGQSWKLDIANMIATPVLNVDLGSYSVAVGFASELSNGNYDFGAGYVNGAGQGQTSEYTSDGALVYRENMYNFSYRPMRLPDLYTLQ